MSSPEDSPAARRRRIAALRDRIGRIDLICSGTLSERTKTCGKQNCRCATDPRARHGPYWEWTWSEGGKLRHKSLSSEQADELRAAIASYRDVQDLVQRWERESAAIILRGRSRKS
jgi:hypothetical protein